MDFQSVFFRTDWKSILRRITEIISGQFLKQWPHSSPHSRIPPAARCANGGIFQLHYLATKLIHQPDELAGGLNRGQCHWAHTPWKTKKPRLDIGFNRGFFKGQDNNRRLLRGWPEPIYASPSRETRLILVIGLVAVVCEPLWLQFDECVHASP